MKSKSSLITGGNYTLSDLFSGDRKIIIPDLQRDYCWGDYVHTDEKKELVSGFVNTLISQYTQSKGSDNLNLGLIYGYESPEDHIQLCDGQQRITTLFLLLGMLNKLSEKNKFQSYLISDFEYHQDDKEPYLQYAIRESSLYFLSDLVCHFFIVDDSDKYHVNSVSDIRRSSWFFNEYESDPSIRSMLNALSIIENILSVENTDWLSGFGDFLTKQLTFLYYDMENRKNGEETFVVINTTGEPLSATQNLKPLVCNAPINTDYCRIDKDDFRHKIHDDWEEVETWFWNNRGLKNDTADAGFNEMLRWVTMLHSSDKKSLQEMLSTGRFVFPVEEIKFDTLFRYWEIVKFLFEEWECKSKLKREWLSPEDNKDVNNTKSISQIACFQLLPLIAYCKQWNIHDNNNRNLLRLYHFLHNLSRIDSVGKVVNEIVYDAILIAKSFEDIVDLVDNQLNFNISTTILSHEELLKLQIIKSDLVHRNEIEEAFWEAQDQSNVKCHHIWSGQILPLIIWASVEGDFKLTNFNNYLSVFDDVFKGDCDANIDIVRRALITRGLNKYPRIFKGWTNSSFAWEWTDWQILINDNLDQFKAFFDDIINGVSLDEMINEYPSSKEWAEFVHKPYLLTFCEQKNIRYDDNLGWMLIKQKNATSWISVKNMHLSKYLRNEISNTGWEIWIWTGNRVVVENKQKNIVFDIWNCSERWIIELFKRNTDSSPLQQYIDNTWKFDGGRFQNEISYMSVVPYEYPEVKDLILPIISKM